MGLRYASSGTQFLRIPSYDAEVPPLPPAPQVVRVAISGLNQTLPWANIINLKYVGAAPTNANLDSLCASIGQLWSTTLGTLVLNSTNVNSVIAQDLTSSSSSVGVSSTNHPGSVATGNPLPVSVAMCITWKTAMRWRGGHPRTYVSGLNITQISSGNQWSGSTVSNALVQAEAFRTGLNGLTAGGASWSFVCLRRHQTLTDGTHVPLDPPLAVPLIATIVDHRIDTQRRRLGPDVSA